MKKKQSKDIETLTVPDNRGRKRKNPSGTRIGRGVRLDPDHFKALAGKNTSEHIDAGLRIVIGAMDNPRMLTFNAVSESITILERKRDSGVEFTDQEQHLLETLYEFWEWLRV